MKKQTPSFEKLYVELEEVVARLESGNLTLDESLEWFERGIKLAQECGEMLDRAELRVKELAVSPEGELTENDLSETE